MKRDRYAELNRALRSRKDRVKQRKAQGNPYFCTKCNMWHVNCHELYLDHKQYNIEGSK